MSLLGLAPVAGGSPLPGYLLVADRYNNRLIIVNPDDQVVWAFPQPGDVGAGHQFGGGGTAMTGPPVAVPVT